MQMRYLFSTVDIELIRQQVFQRSKDEVKKASTYIADFAHDDAYFESVERVLNRTIQR